MLSKHRLLYFVLLVFLGHVGLAQDVQQAKKTRKGEFTGFAKAGLVASQMYNDDYGGYNKLGGTAGFGVSTPISSNGKFQLELNYAMRGSRKPADPENGDLISIMYEAHYIDIPLLFKSFIWKFEYEVGLCNGILIGSREAYNNWLPPPYLQAKPFNRYELALNLGINVPITEVWMFNPRFHYSLLPAAGKFGFVNGLSLAGGAFHNAISFSLVRVFSPK